MLKGLMYVLVASAYGSFVVRQQQSDDSDQSSSEQQSDSWSSGLSEAGSVLDDDRSWFSDHTSPKNVLELAIQESNRKNAELQKAGKVIPSRKDQLVGKVEANEVDLQKFNAFTRYWGKSLGFREVTKLQPGAMDQLVKTVKAEQQREDKELAKVESMADALFDEANELKNAEADLELHAANKELQRKVKELTAEVTRGHKDFRAEMKEAQKRFGNQFEENWWDKFGKARAADKVAVQAERNVAHRGWTSANSAFDKHASAGISPFE